VLDTRAFAIGQWAYVQGAGWFVVTANDNLIPGTLTLRNDNSPGNSVPTATVAPIGNLVTGGGPAGVAAYTTLTAGFTMPSIGATQVASVVDARPFAVGQWAYIAGAGWFTVTATDTTANTLTLRNDGSPGNQPAAIAIASGAMVNG